MSQVILQIRDVYKTYKTKRGIVNALNGVSLDIYAGEILSLLGVNGAGKTTLSSIIATLHPPTSGQVLYDGISIYKDVFNYKKVIGFCPQKPNLDLELSVEQNLLFAGRYFLMPESQVQEKTKELLQRFDLEKYKHFPVQALSGGYKQRLLIARAIIHDPKIVILDEPTVGLDPHIRRHLWQIIKELKQQGMTVILTTHYLEEAEVLSDRVCMLSKGSIIMTATVDDLKIKHKKATLEEIFIELVEEEENR